MKSRVAVCGAVCAAVLLSLGAGIAAAQGRPDIRWMRGGHGSVINRLASSSDGTFFVSISSDHTIKIWRTSDGMLLRTIVVAGGISPGASGALALSPDNSTVCGGGVDGSGMPTIGCWHVSDGSLVWSTSVSGVPAGTLVAKLAFSPDSTRLASAVGSRLPIFNASNGSFIADFSTGYPGHVLAGGLAYSPDNLFLGVNASNLGGEGRLALLNAATGTVVWDYAAAPLSFAYDVAFSPDSQLVASVNGAGLHVFGTTDHLDKLFNTGSPSTTVAFSPSGTRIATGWAGTGWLNLFNASTGLLTRQWNAHGSTTGLAPAVTFSADATRLLSGNFDIKRWKASDGTFDALVTAQAGPAWFVALSADERVVAVATNVASAGSQDEHSISLYRASDGALLRYVEYGSLPLTGLAISPDGHHAAASDSASLRVWNVDTGALERTTDYPGGSSSLRPLAYKPDGTAVAVGGDRESIISLWNPATGAITSLVAGAATALRFLPAPDGRLVVAKQISPVAYPSVVQIVTLAGHIDRELFGLQSVGSLSVSPDGNTIAAGGVDGAFSPYYVTRLWRVSDGATLQTLVGHTGDVRGVAFAWDSQTVITASRDATVRIWRASDGSQWHLYDAETYMPYLSAPDGVWAVAASTRSARFLYGRGDGTLVDATNPEAGPKIQTFTVPTISTGSCKAVSAKIVLDRPAPPAGVILSLASDSASASVPDTLTVTGGKSSKSFKITTSPMASLQSATISATLDSQTEDRSLGIRPIGISSLTLLPATVTGGGSVSGAVTLECKAGPGDIVVHLTSTLPAFAQPTVSTVTIPHGTTDGAFTVSTAPVGATKKPTIRAATVPDAQSKSTKLVINP